ncbi:hypothetical protein WG922_21430 [Ramlibacter sp. AN1015]|uniref:hypothetical protein n=1 Tax=Ramlibacter sp. AN1015 TaxID=3133428 RepID=UPI0030C3D8A7
MANEPVTITATVAVWLSPYTKPHELTAALQHGDAVGAASMLTLYGGPDKETFSDYARMGEADVTIRLIPHDEQVRFAVQALQEQLDKARAAFHREQQRILAEIGKLQALTYDAEVSA